MSALFPEYDDTATSKDAAPPPQAVGDFCCRYYDSLIAKKNAQQPLNEMEEISYLLISMLLAIEMDGFSSLFDQFYSLRECEIVENNLRKFGFYRLADQFSEAKHLYIGDKVDITENEYKDINPFEDEELLRRLDEIGDEILAEGSEIYLVGDHVCKYVMSRESSVKE